MRNLLKSRWLLMAGMMFVLGLLTISDTHGQGRGFDPNKSFDDLAKYNGGGDTVDFAKLPRETKDKMNKFASFSGAPPFPETGTMSRTEYLDRSNKAMEAMKAKFGSKDGGGRGGPPGGFSGGPPGGFSGGPPGSSTGAPGSTGGTDEWATSAFKRSDRNNDSVITMDEASDRLKPVFAQTDTNSDGKITMDEYKIYISSRMSTNGGSTPNGSSSFQPQPGTPGFDPNSNSRDRDRGREREEEAAITRVSVSRYGHLPKEVPGWFEELDTDRDGMVGLYEWRRAEKVSKDFVAMDLNGDCYLTADEWVRHQKNQLERTDESPSGGDRSKTTTDKPSNDRNSDRSDRSKGGPPERGSKDRDRSKDSKDTKKNPFSN